MSNVYEVIEAVRIYKGYSYRELAEKAGLRYTTLVSLLTRRSSRISEKALKAIADGLGVSISQLMPFEFTFYLNGTGTPRLSAEISDEKVGPILRNLIGDDYGQYLDQACVKSSAELPSINTRKLLCEEDARERFKQSIDFVLDKLNDEGLMEAMRQILAIAQEPKYCVSIETSKKKEDD